MQLPESYQKRILNEEQAIPRIDSGWKKSDLHIHSTCSPDVLPCPEFHPEAIYQTSRKRGLDYISITDHDCMDAYDIIGWEREGLVPGVEISLSDYERVGHTIHVNVFQLNKAQFTELERIAMEAQDIELFIAFLRDQNLPYMFNHPFWFQHGEAPNISSVLNMVELFPAVEYNMKRVQKRNYMALWLAARYNKGILANTDTHIGEMGATYTLAQGNTFDEFFHNIVNNQACIVPKDMDIQSLNEEIDTWIEKFFAGEGMQDKPLSLSKNPSLDSILNYVANHPVDRHPLLFGLLERCARQVSRTGIISRVFVGYQNRQSTHICHELQIPTGATASFEHPEWCGDDVTVREQPVGG